MIPYCDLDTCAATAFRTRDVLATGTWNHSCPRVKTTNPRSIVALSTRTKFLYVSFRMPRMLLLPLNKQLTALSIFDYHFLEY